jgi:hypothetical protein
VRDGGLPIFVGGTLHPQWLLLAPGEPPNAAAATTLAETATTTTPLNQEGRAGFLSGTLTRHGAGEQAGNDGKFEQFRHQCHVSLPRASAQTSRR